MSYKPVVLIVLDGFGIWREQRGNPIYLAYMPNLTKLSRSYPGVALHASGIEVGLPWGEMGNSEVGHANIGAGLVLYQNLPRIHFAIQDQSFFKLKIWDELIDHAKQKNSAIHLMGLVSNGGIHSHIDHLAAILELLKQRRVKQPVFIHVFTDGEDTPPGLARQFLKIIQDKIKVLKIGKVATVMGRHYAMDKSQNWHLSEAAYNCLVKGQGRPVTEPEAALIEADEFVQPSVVVDKKNQPVGIIKSGDSIFFFNFRADRARQLVELFLKSGPADIFLASMTEYSKDYPIKVAFPPQLITHPLAKVVADAGKKQLHVAETEKYAHITYFLNGGREKAFADEERMIIPSVKVESYDLQPELSAYEIKDKILAAIRGQQYDFIAVNFANADLVAHTGNIEAAAHALTVLDDCVGKIVSAVLDYGGAAVITADHGNIEEMLNLATGKSDTEHSTNPVPCWIITLHNKLKEPVTEVDLSEVIPAGILADVAPTVLELLNIPKPKEMTGRSLLKETSVLVLK